MAWWAGSLLLFGDTMNFFLIRKGNESVVVQAFTWQKACLASAGSISRELAIKPLGEWIGNKHWVEKRSQDRSGWFRPAIMDDEPLTLREDKALGPKEISELMLAAGQAIKTANNKSEAEAAYNDVTWLLRYIPIDAAERFSEYYNMMMRALP